MSAMSHRYKALGPLKNFASAAIWWIASIGLFVGVWEFCWYMKWANPMLFPPPHIFLQDLYFVGKLFDKSTRLGNPTPGLIVWTIAKTIGASTLRVLIGLCGQFGDRHRNTVFTSVRTTYLARN